MAPCRAAPPRPGDRLPAVRRAAARAVAASAALALVGSSADALAAGFNVSDASVLEATGTNTTLQFTVSYNPRGSDPMAANVNYATADGSAVAPADYVPKNGSLGFNGP